MWYEYRCEVCGQTHETQEFRRIGTMLCGCPCGGRVLRIVSMPQVAPASPDAYFNYSIGEVCTSTKDFETKLALNARKATDKDGIPRQFSPVYPAEGRAHAESVSKTDAELERLN
jgi:hypothetical protein